MLNKGRIKEKFCKNICLTGKLYGGHKECWFPYKNWFAVLKIDACATTRQNINLTWPNNNITFNINSLNAVWQFGHIKNFKKTTGNNLELKACARYFSLFLKDKCISSLFRTKYIENKFNLQLFFLPTVSLTFILS